MRTDPAGRPVRVIGTALDVTEQRQLEQQLLQAQKMEGIGRLAGGVAHDFNNLLTVILGLASSARGSLGDHARLTTDIEGIEEAATRAAALTRQLLAFARKQLTQPRALDLNAVVLRMDAMLRRLIGEDGAPHEPARRRGRPVLGRWFPNAHTVHFEGPGGVSVTP